MARSGDLSKAGLTAEGILASVLPVPPWAERALNGAVSDLRRCQKRKDLSGMAEARRKKERVLRALENFSRE